MADYIDRQMALNAFCDNCDTVQAVCPHYPCKKYTSVETLPSADVVEVVRCKDCINRVDKFDLCRLVPGTWKANDYCSYGVQKGGN